MALASQSFRSSRSYRRPSMFFRPMTFIAVGAACSLGAGYWLLSADAGTAAAATEGTRGDGFDPAAADGGSVAAALPSMRAAPQLASSDVPEARRSSTSALDALVAEAADRATGAAQTTPPAGSTPATPTAGAPASPPAAPPAPGSPAETPPTAPVRNGLDPATRANDAASSAAPAGTPEAELALGLSIAASEPVKARQHLSNALLSGKLGPIDAKRASDSLVAIGETLAFTPVYNANDPMFFQYTVAPNDTLEKIVRRHKIGCDWRLVQRINKIKKPEAIRVGQRLKLPKGPFSAVVSKRDYRVDLCMGAGADRVVITSLPCGLGSANGTPTGGFRVRPGSKLLNPEWIHPVTSEYFAADDPKNPIGEHWLGLEGTDATNAQLAGYGIHGTIDADSIGQDRSLGCVRLLAEDIAIVWECLGDGAEVEIRP